MRRGILVSRQQDQPEVHHLNHPQCAKKQPNFQKVIDYQIMIMKRQNIFLFRTGKNKTL